MPMMNSRLVLLILWSVSLTLLQPRSILAQDASHAGRAKVTVEADGTVQVPTQAVPMSAFLSPEAKAYVTQHLKDMQNPEIVKQDAGVPRFMKPYLERDHELFA